MFDTSLRRGHLRPAFVAIMKFVVLVVVESGRSLDSRVA